MPLQPRSNPALLASALLPSFVVRTFAQRSPFSAIAASEVITGYGDHQQHISEMNSGHQADSRFLIGQLAHEFVVSVKSDEPIREIQFIGHSDRVLTGGQRRTADEQKVSEERAKDARAEMLSAILRDPAGTFTPLELADAIRSGEVRILVVGMGARFPLRVSLSGATPENRRVEILLLTKQSIDI